MFFRNDCFLKQSYKKRSQIILIKTIVIRFLKDQNEWVVFKVFSIFQKTKRSFLKTKKNDRLTFVYKNNWQPYWEQQKCFEFLICKLKMNTNLNFLIFLSLQLDIVSNISCFDISKYKFFYIKKSKFEMSKVDTIRLHSAQILGLIRYWD